MDKKVEQISSLHRKLESPLESRVSAVVNGVLNGGTIAVLPAILLELLTGKDLPNKRPIVILATITGCALGGLYGMHEASRLQEYRDNLNDTINKLRNDVDAHAAMLDGKKLETVSR